MSQQSRLYSRQSWWKLSRRRSALRRLRLVAIRTSVWLGISSVIIGSGFGLYWWQDGTLSLFVEETAASAENMVNDISRDTDMVVQKVVVEGRIRTPVKDIEKAAEVSAGDPMLGLDLNAIKQRVEQISWIDSAEIYRNLPGTIRICITERVPVALLQEKGRLSLIDKNGRKIESALIDDYSYLPVVSGAGAPENAYRLITMFSETPELFGRVSAAVRVGERRWNVKFYNGVEVMLPEKNEDVAWSDFARLQKDQAILDKSVLRIDLRQEGRAYVRMTKDSAPFVINSKGGDSI